MSGRKATTEIIPGDKALSVGKPNSNLPNGWVWSELNELAELATGHTPSRKHPEYWDGDIPWMAVRDASKYNGRTIYETKEHINQLGLNNSAAVLLPKNTVCLSRTASIGYSILLGVEMATSQGFVNWVCSNGLLPRFLQLVFFSEKRFLYSISEGTAHTTIYFPEVKAFHIALPPLAEQKRIVAKLDDLFTHLDTLKAKLDRIPQLLKNFRQQVLALAVTGKLTEDWREGRDLEDMTEFVEELAKKREVEYHKALAHAKANKLKKPKKNYVFEFKPHSDKDSWCIAKLDNLIYMSARIGWKGLKAEEYTNEGPLFLSVHGLNYGENVNYDVAYHISQERYDESPEIKLEENDILLCKDGAGIGKLGIVKNLKNPATVNSSLLVLRGKEALNYKYLYYFLAGPSLQNIAKERITGSAIPHLFQRDIKEFYLEIPSHKEQIEIVRRVDSLFSVADKIEFQYNLTKVKIDNLPQAILNKTFKGELVPQDLNDEPVSALLERIKDEMANKKPIKKKIKSKSKNEYIESDTLSIKILEILKKSPKGISSREIRAELNQEFDSLNIDACISNLISKKKIGQKFNSEKKEMEITINK
jgi:type I restriction enzyme, S subunit